MNINADTFDGTLALTNSEGEETIVDILDWFKWNDQEYIVVTCDDFAPYEVSVLQVVTKSDGSESYELLENENDEQAVLSEFAGRMGWFISRNIGHFD